MSFTPDMGQLRGLTYETASLYGMPHVGCFYKREDMAATALADGARCLACGRGDGLNRHHEPPRSKGTFVLATPKGRFVLLPALIALCGSGTTGCHGMRHSGRLSFRWEWDSDEKAQMWWDGTFLSKGLRPNGPWLYKHGRYVVESDGITWEYRGEI